MLMFSTTATIGQDGMLSVRLPGGIRRGLHEVTIIVRDEARGGATPAVSAEVDPVGDAIGVDPAAEAAAYQAVYHSSGR